MIELVPAIDLIEGKCVRLTQGDYATQKIYNEDPLEVAKQFEDNGLHRLHVVDLDGAREGHIVNYRILERIATRTSLLIDFGGGLKHHLNDFAHHPTPVGLIFSLDELPILNQDKLDTFKQEAEEEIQLSLNLVQ